MRHGAKKEPMVEYRIYHLSSFSWHWGPLSFSWSSASLLLRERRGGKEMMAEMSHTTTMAALMRLGVR